VRRSSGIAEFYAIEKDIRGRSAEERRLIRQRKSRPLAETFEQWLRAKLALTSHAVHPITVISRAATNSGTTAPPFTS
jgi:hypothetical protein